MDERDALLAFAALSQPTRLAVFRLLIAHEPDGLAAGEIARRLDVPQNTMSTHFGVLARAGLIGSERRSRSIVYRARTESITALADFLLRDCCGGRPEACRPSDDVVEDDGEPALRDREIDGSDPGLVAALTRAGLPTDDLHEPGRRFFVYSTPSGRVVGHAGLEIYGSDALLRSLVVVPEARGQGFGGAILARLGRRAFDAGARRAFTLTTTVGDWLEKKGFVRIERSQAPAAILDTRQARSLCPASAVLLTRTIRL